MSEQTENQEKIDRFRHHYKEFIVPIAKEDAKKIQESLANVSVDKSMVLVSSKDMMKPTFACLFAKKGFVSYKFMSAYSLLDVYLGNNEDYKTILDISADVVCLYLGYGEFENKRQDDVIIQLMSYLEQFKHHVWLYFKGGMNELRLNHGDLCQFIGSSGGAIVDMNHSSGGGGRVI